MSKEISICHKSALFASAPIELRLRTNLGTLHRTYISKFIYRRAQLCYVPIRVYDSAILCFAIAWLDSAIQLELIKRSILYGTVKVQRGVTCKYTLVRTLRLFEPKISK